MKERYEIKCAVFLMLTRMENETKKILLQRRFHTGILDGQYDVSCSGHLEKNETVREAMVRETKEELGIKINENDLTYSSTIHANFEGTEYLLIAISSNVYQGTPAIMEKDKCDDLEWFDMNDLPKNLADTRRIMIENDKNGIRYSEYGWDKILRKGEK